MCVCVCLRVFVSCQEKGLSWTLEVKSMKARYGTVLNGKVIKAFLAHRSLDQATLDAAIVAAEGDDVPAQKQLPPTFLPKSVASWTVEGTTAFHWAVDATWLDEIAGASRQHS